MAWRDVTNTFSEKRRHYKDTYLEIDEVLEGGKETAEVSLFSCDDGIYEIYMSYGIMYGISYVDKVKADAQREAMKKDLEEEYEKTNGEGPSDDFINAFCKKYEIGIPNDIFFDFDIVKMAEKLDKIFRH